VNGSGNARPRRVARGHSARDALGMEITCVTIDSADPAAAASFWNDALQWGGVATSDDGDGAICGPRSGGWYLEFVRVPEAKTTKNRVHLGCSAGPLDALELEIARLRQLGATFAWEEDFSPDIRATYRNVVLRDPEGNEFCVSAGRHERLSAAQ
jgi:catechol 2,3-dioxygenase-like lactoylglutathione lyase family enzyme